MKTIRVLQLGAEDFSKSIRVAECAEWNYEPDFSELPEKDFEVVILDRKVTAEEFEFLIRFTKAYCLFVTENVSLRQGEAVQQLFIRKMGKKISQEEDRKSVV